MFPSPEFYNSCALPHISCLTVAQLACMIFYIWIFKVKQSNEHKNQQNKPKETPTNNCTMCNRFLPQNLYSQNLPGSFLNAKLSGFCIRLPVKKHSLLYLGYWASVNIVCPEAAQIFFNVKQR